MIYLCINKKAVIHTHSSKYNIMATITTQRTGTYKTAFTNKLFPIYTVSADDVVIGKTNQIAKGVWVATNIAYTFSTREKAIAALVEAYEAAQAADIAADYEDSEVAERVAAEEETIANTYISDAAILKQMLELYNKTNLSGAFASDMISEIESQIRHCEEFALNSEVAERIAVEEAALPLHINVEINKRMAINAATLFDMQPLQNFARCMPINTTITAKNGDVYFLWGASEFPAYMAEDGSAEIWAFTNSRPCRWLSISLGDAPRPAFVPERYDEDAAAEFWREDAIPF